MVEALESGEKIKHTWIERMYMRKLFFYSVQTLVTMLIVASLFEPWVKKFKAGHESFQYFTM